MVEIKMIACCLNFVRKFVSVIEENMKSSTRGHMFSIMKSKGDRSKNIDMMCLKADLQILTIF